LSINWKREKIILKQKKGLNIKERVAWKKILKCTTTAPVADLGKLIKFFL